MADNAQKTWLPLSLNRFGQKKAAEAIQLLGKALPASVAAIPTAGVPIFTVKFEVNAAPFTIPNVTVPLFGPEWVRYPIGVGTKGVVFPADAYLGGVSGLGDGVAQIGQLPGNLSALVFFPIGNSKWEANDEPETVLIYGPDGVVIRSVDKTAVMKVTKAENSWKPPAGQPIVLDSNVIIKGGLALRGRITSEDGVTPYDQNIETTGEVIAKFGAGQVGLSSHQHAQANDSDGDAEQPTDAPTPGT